LRDYQDVFDDVRALGDQWKKVLLGKKWAYTQGPSFAIYRQLDAEKLEFNVGPVLLMKASKNEAEIRGMQSANIRDSVAFLETMMAVEDGMANGEDWDELMVANYIKERRKKQAHYKGNSFKTIAAYGANAAIIHYKPNKKTNTKLGKDSLLLLDSGAQYYDGTTDSTRTLFFGDGEPDAFHKEAYTRVLGGAIDLARAVFPGDTTTDTRLDILARQHLLRVGLNYRHGTGHGIGAYGLIHESPIQLRVYKKEEHPLKKGYFFSDEPGYYQVNVNN